MKSLLRLIALIVDLLSWFYPLLLSVIASSLLAIVVYPLLASASLAVVLVALPLLYLLWLFLFVGAGAIVTALMFLGFQKPTSLKVDLSFSSPQDLMMFISAARVLALYRMGLLMQRLPALNYSVMPPLIFAWMNRLVLRAYAPSVHIGQGSLVISRSQDPDLTYIGNRVVIGSNCQLVCHALNTSGGYLKYACAPITIGDEVTIGGNAYLGMGIEIGRGAVVEMGSNLLPYTRIAPYEVWGGNPAKLLRTKAAQETTTYKVAQVQDLAAQSDESDAVSQAIDSMLAEVLRLPIEQITADLDSSRCSDWDSLAKMAIAAALFDHFGLRLSPADMVQLNSRRAVQAIVQSASPAAYKAADENVVSSGTGAASRAAEVLVGGNSVSLPDDPELLPLGDFQATTRLLAQRYHSSAKAGYSSDQTPEKIVRVAATFTAQPLVSSLVLWCRAFGIHVSVDFLTFNQVEPTLLDANSPFYDQAGINVVLVRPEDLLGPVEIDGLSRAQQIMAAIRHYAQQRPGLIVSNLPPTTSIFPIRLL
ncbi:MAG: hypothetical protein HC800_09260 [Phormidesmis sp. RL_2_1]|nr:hypothetical protein [Phormidesmis sp. RL_2_1]